MSHQERIHDFLLKRDLLDLDEQMEKVTEEQQEFWEAMAILQSDDSDEAIEAAAIEAVDNIIVLTGIVGILGFDTSELIEHKLDINEMKYNLRVFNNLLDDGNSPEQAKTILKDFWNEINLIRMGRF